MAFFGAGVKPRHRPNTSRRHSQKDKKRLAIYFVSRIFRLMNISSNKRLLEIPLEQFADRLGRLVDRIEYSQAAQDQNYLARGIITIPQVRALQQVAERKTCAMRMLAMALQLKFSTITGIVDRLVNLGLLKRFNSQTDRRVVLAEITPKGRKILDHVRSEKRKVIARLFQHVSPRERTDFLEIMEKIVLVLSVAEEGGNTTARHERNR